MRKLNLAIVLSLFVSMVVYGADYWTSPNQGVIRPISGINYVGIGTSNPAYPLHVNGTVLMTGFRLTTGATNGYVLTCGSGGVGEWKPAPGGGGGTSYWDENANGIHYEDGNVGIGTPTPSCELDVAGDINIGNSNVFKFGGEDFIKRWETSRSFAISKNAGAEESGSVYIGYYAGNSNTGIYSTLLGYYAGYSNTGGSLTAIGWNAGYQNAGGGLTAVGRMAGRNNTGNDVTAIGYQAGSYNDGDNTCGFGLRALNHNSGDNVIAVGYEAAKSNTVSNVFILKQDNVNTTPLIYGNFSNGKVGIGTDDPQSKLAVNGTITAEEIEVQVDILPDFVFEDNYKLMPLNKLEQHIKKVKSLPGIPTSDEAVKEGVKLGEMQAKLLQKVEELTLYVIEQNKELTELKKEIGDLRKENKELRHKMSSLSLSN